MEAYRIKDWNIHFENSESRKVKLLRWAPMPNKHDGKGYRRLVAHVESVNLFCAWNLIVQVASKMPTRGVLIDEDGPLTSSDLSFITGFPESIFELGFSILSDPAAKINWIEKFDTTAEPQKPTQEPENPRKLPGEPGNNPDQSGDAGLEGKGIEGNGKEEGASAEPPPARREKAKEPQSIESIIAELSKEPAYEFLDVRNEALKMVVWCNAKKRKPTKARLINWLNRCDPPIRHAGSAQVGPNI